MLDSDGKKRLCALSATRGRCVGLEQQSRRVAVARGRHELSALGLPDDDINDD